MLHRALGDDPRIIWPRRASACGHRSVSREREGVGEVIGSGGREAIGRAGHAPASARDEQDEDDGALSSGLRRPPPGAMIDLPPSRAVCISVDALAPAKPASAIAGAERLSRSRAFFQNRAISRPIRKSAIFLSSRGDRAFSRWPEETKEGVNFFYRESRATL